MTEEQMRLQAFKEAHIFGEVDCQPVISGEFDSIVNSHKRASIHAVSMAYVYGSVVQLDPRNGHRYLCIEGGTSAAIEPYFSTCDAGVTSDGTCIWREEGPDYSNVYDLRAILHDCWMTKASKSSGLIDAREVGSASQIQAQCRARARDFEPLGVA